MIISPCQKSCFLVLILMLPSAAEACRYTVRDVAMVDLADPHYVLCLITKGELEPSLAETLTNAASPILADSNVEFRLFDAGQQPTDPADASIHSALESLGITSYPAAVMLAPDGRALELPLMIDGLTSDDNPIQIAVLRQLLRSATTSPRRKELLHYLLRGHSMIMLVDGPDSAENQRAVSWIEDAIARVHDALPTMAKPIELPPRMIRLSPEEAKREMILLWSLGVDLAHEVNTGETRVAQIALLFGRGRKLGPVLQIPGSRQQDLWRSLGVVGSDCECGLDRSWMQGPMIPHVWSTEDEAEAVAALGFDPGNPLVKAEISRILARGPSQSKRANRSLEEPLQPQLQLGEIDIDALVSEQTVPSEESHQEVQPEQTLDRVTAKAETPLTGQSDASRTEKTPQDGASALQGAFVWVLVALGLVGVLGSLGVFLLGRKKQS
ncbi:MAG: hypothetical protein GXP26_04140 [Planctomycetes bacterium]|nr:hypothetical protein [Planctomycetota bacterium]